MPATLSLSANYGLCISLHWKNCRGDLMQYGGMNLNKKWRHWGETLSWRKLEVYAQKWFGIKVILEHYQPLRSLTRLSYNNLESINIVTFCSDEPSISLPILVPLLFHQQWKRESVLRCSLYFRSKSIIRGTNILDLKKEFLKSRSTVILDAWNERVLDHSHFVHSLLLRLPSLKFKFTFEILAPFFSSSTAPQPMPQRRNQ